MLTFLLDTKLGHLLLGLVCMALIGAGMYWKGHNRGWDAATTHYSAVVNSCLRANGTEEAAIEQLRQANAAYAQAAAVSHAEQEHAAQAVARQHAADVAALNAAQARLNHVMGSNPTVAAWGSTPVPGAVAGILRQ
jgi:hypothetical protein